ncbi:MAG TPA: hypothetical protein VHE61_20795 [Opitutaceae bacterium]|nr:hypothetical protein [Opitutaceae bacterium]
MNSVRHIQHVGVELPPPTEGPSAARERLRDRFPRTMTRRMTHLGLLVGAVLDGVTLTPEDAVVYASTFAETGALENYLASFPAASPALFQTSIHPGAVQQVLIGRQQPVARLWPLAGRERQVEQAILTALLETSSRVVLTGGEERGTWMLEHGVASDRAFAFGCVLTRDPQGAIGAISLQGDTAGADRAPTLIEFAEALAARRTLRWAGEAGTISLTWRTPGTAARSSEPEAG